MRKMPFVPGDVRFTNAARIPFRVSMCTVLNMKCLEIYIKPMGSA